MPNDFINIIEREIIKQLRIDFPNAHVYGQFPDAVDVKYPTIIIEIVASGADEQFIGQQVTFGASDTKTTGEIYGVLINLHLVVDKNSVETVNGTGYKQRRLLNYLMLNVANTVTDLSFPSTVEITERHLRAWSDVGYIPGLELWGASASYMVSFKNYRAV